MSDLSQPQGSTSKGVNKQSIARILGVMVKDITYLQTGINTSDFLVLFDKNTEKYFYTGNATGTLTSYTVSDILTIVTSTGTYSCQSAVLSDNLNSTDCLRYADYVGGTYLPILSDMRNGSKFELARAITKSEYNLVKNGTSTKDYGDLINNVLNDSSYVELSEGTWTVGKKIIIPARHEFIGLNAMRDYTNNATSIIKCTHSDIGIQSTGEGTAIKKITIIGNSNLDCGIEISSGNCTLIDVGVNSTKNQGIRVLSASVASVLQDIIVVNTMYDRANFSTIKGAIDVQGTDHFLYRVEANGQSGFSTVVANRKSVALRVGGTNNFISDCIGEFGEVGVYVDGTRCRFSNVRADRCMGDGFYITGSSNSFSNPMSIGIGSAASNTYDGFFVSGVFNLFNGANVLAQDNTVPRYGINDTVSSASQWNVWTNPLVQASVGTQKFINNNYLGSPFTFPNKQVIITSGNNLSVEGITYFYINPSSALTIDTISRGVNSQEIQIHAANALLTLQNNSSIILKNNTTRTLSTNEIITLINFNGKWYEK